MDGVKNGSVLTLIEFPQAMLSFSMLSRVSLFDLISEFRALTSQKHKHIRSLMPEQI